MQHSQLGKWKFVMCDVMLCTDCSIIHPSVTPCQHGRSALAPCFVAPSLPPTQCLRTYGAVEELFRSHVRHMLVLATLTTGICQWLEPCQAAQLHSMEASC